MDEPLIMKEFQYFKDMLKFYHRKLIPLVGEDCFLLQGRQDNLQSYIVDAFLQKFPQEAGSLSPQEASVLKSMGYYGITRLRQLFRKDFEFHYATFIREVKDQITLHPSVQAFLSAATPPLILTTSIFDFLDKALPGYSVQHFRPGDVNFQDIDRPTVCHIFGKMRETVMDTNDKGVIGEEELLEFLHAWNNPKSLHSNFLQRFQGCGLLVLGCDSLPNWIFRFLWYPLSKSEAGKGFFLGDEQCTHDASSNPEAASSSLSFSDFLRRINYKSSPAMFQLLSAVAGEIRQSAPTPVATMHHDFFISYASEDAGLAKTITDELTAQGLDVWLDKQRPKELDGQYWKGIEDAIKCSTYIMPIVTGHFVERFFGESRVRENKKSALEEETERYTRILLDRFNGDEDKMITRIIPVLLLGETATIIEKRKSVQVAVAPACIDSLSVRNDNFSIFDHINFRYYDKADPSTCTFKTTDWSTYKSQG